MMIGGHWRKYAGVFTLESKANNCCFKTFRKNRFELLTDVCLRPGNKPVAFEPLTRTQLVYYYIKIKQNGSIKEANEQRES